MTTQQEHSKEYRELYDFVRQTLEATFRVKHVSPSAVLSDDLGLEPIDWYVLVDCVEHRYGIEFTAKDLTLLDRDKPTVDGFVRMALRRLGHEQPPDDEVLNVVAAAIDEIMSFDSLEITPEMSFAEDLGANSLTVIEIVMLCEDKLDVRVTDEALRDLNTVRNLVDYLSEQRLKQAAA